MNLLHGLGMYNKMKHSYLVQNPFLSILIYYYFLENLSLDVFILVNAHCGIDQTE